MPVAKPRATSTREPHAPRPRDTPAVAAWRIRMGTTEAQQIYRVRGWRRVRAIALCSRSPTT